MVLLDGFEKICPKYKEPVSRLLKMLLDLEIPLWVTTRLEEEKELKEKLQGPRLNFLRINRLGEEEQFQVLKFKMSKNKDFCDEIVKCFKCKGAADFLEIPGHLALVAETYKKCNFQVDK